MLAVIEPSGAISPRPALAKTVSTRPFFRRIRSYVGSKSASLATCTFKTGEIHTNGCFGGVKLSLPAAGNVDISAFFYKLLDHSGAHAASTTCYEGSIFIVR